MKKIGIIFTAILLFYSCKKTTEIIGYIPIGEKPKIQWIKESESSLPWLYFSVLVRTGVSKEDTLRVSIDNSSNFQGAFCVKYRDTYPPAINKVVYVRLHKLGDSPYYITEASTYPLK